MKPISWRRPALLAAILGAAALLVATMAAVTGQTPLFDDAPSKEKVIREARQRGITEPINVPERSKPDSNARPERYGPYLLAPQGWKGPLDEPTVIATVPDGRGTNVTDEVKTSELWVDAAHIPEGYRLVSASSGNLAAEVRQMYKNAVSKGQFFIYVAKQQVIPIRIETWNTNAEAGGPVNSYTKTEIEGRPAIISRLMDDGAFRVSVDVFDPSTGRRFVVHALDPLLSLDEAVETMKGLLP